jgi:putative NADPH-quinone reductase
MRALVVHAHPSPDSLSAALFATTTAALRRRGHEVAALDLYGEHFAPAMSAEERRAYPTDSPICSPQVAHHAAMVRWADALVFVYPSWFAGPPAVLKGWLERVLVTGVAFHLDDRTSKVVSDVRHVRAVVGISTYRSTWAAVRLAHDSGRRILLRALRMLCARTCRTTWLALYSVDTATSAQRDAFMAKVERRLDRL